MVDNEKPGTANRERTLILNGAARAFGRLGYAACTEDDIIAEAGVSPESFAYEFGDKLAVFNAVEEMFTFSLTQAMRSQLETDLDRPTIEDLLDTYLRWITVWRDVARTMWADPTRPYPVKANSRDSSLAEFTAVIGLVPEVCGRNQLDPVLIRGLAGATREISLAMLQSTKMIPSDIEQARQAIDMIVRGTLALRSRSGQTHFGPL